MSPAPVMAPSDSERLAALENIHLGERVFIIGNGPSLSMFDLDRLTGEICFAANKIYLAFEDTDWRPTYYGVEDKLVMVQNVDIIRPLSGFTKFFPTIFDRWVPRMQEAVYFDLIVEDFFPDQPHFSRDAVHGIYWGSTIVYSMIQLACFMGSREIYLLGVDYDFQIPDVRDERDSNILISQGECNHFHPDYRKPGERWFVPNLEVSIKSYEAARDSMKGLGGTISNATRGGKLDVFPRVDIDRILSG